MNGINVLAGPGYTNFNNLGTVGASAWGTRGIQLTAYPGVYTDNSTAAGATTTNSMINAFGQPTLGSYLASATSNVTFTNAATVYVAGAPIAGANVAITNPYALDVATGNIHFLPPAS